MQSLRHNATPSEIRPTIGRERETQLVQYPSVTGRPFADTGFGPSAVASSVESPPSTRYNVTRFWPPTSNVATRLLCAV